MTPRRWPLLCLAALYVAACSATGDRDDVPSIRPAASAASVDTEGSPVAPTPVPRVSPGQRLVQDGPLLAIHDQCYGECRWIEHTPRWAVYDDGLVTRTGFRDDYFFMESARLPERVLARVIERAVVARLDTGAVGAAGVVGGSDGGGTIFTSALGPGGTFVHAPWLRAETEVESDATWRAALRDLEDFLLVAADDLEWTPIAPEWVLLVSADSAAWQEWWPVLKTVDLAGSADDARCVKIGPLAPGGEAEQELAQATATFGLWQEVGPERHLVATPRALLPHEDGCDHVLAYLDWFWDTNNRIDLS